ncbi:hypothetical protein OAN96_00620 [Candidatus Gracilibacteria bacterium]|nr:hypothetical protein [Candidatus Gracilibacteria bacterium]
MGNIEQTEVESKILEVGYKDLRDIIFDLGGKALFDEKPVLLSASWFKNIHGDEVRIRQEGDKIEVEYKKLKGISDGVKEMVEVGFEAKKVDDVVLFLNALGFEENTSYRSVKDRVFYILQHDKYGDVNFHFDNYSDLGGHDDIPEFMEIEVKQKEFMIPVANMLGFTKDDLKDYDPGELLDHYKK